MPPQLVIPSHTDFGWGVRTFNWSPLIRQYTGFETAVKSNERKKKNRAAGMSGDSDAYDVVFQKWLSIDHPMAAGQVGAAGVPMSHIGDMEALYDGVAIAGANISQTINDPALWAAALVYTMARRRGHALSEVNLTVQNDHWKEETARGAWVLNPVAARQNQIDLLRFNIVNSPGSNAFNGGLYHLAEVGATPDEEIAFGLCSAFRILDALRDLRDDGKLTQTELDSCAKMISFFAWCGTDHEVQACKFRALHTLWDEALLTRYNVQDPACRIARIGAQSSSINLRRETAEVNLFRLNNVMWAATYGGLISLQISCADEAFRTPDELFQWLSLRTQQTFLYETDVRSLGRNADGTFREPRARNELFIGSSEDKLHGARHFEGLTAALVEAARRNIEAVYQYDTDADRLAYIKRRLLLSQRQRIAALQNGGVDLKTRRPYGLPTIGLNCFTERPGAGLFPAFEDKPENSPEVERQEREKLDAWRRQRNSADVAMALRHLREAIQSGSSRMEALMECADRGVTTGETGAVFREETGAYRPPNALVILGDAANTTPLNLDTARVACEAFEARHGRRPFFVIGATGLDGHSTGSEQVSMAAKAAGAEVLYLGIQIPPAEIAETVFQNRPHLLCMSIMSGGVVPLTANVLAALVAKDVEAKAAAEGTGDEPKPIANTPIVVGGIISERERAALLEMGVVGVYTPADSDFSRICEELIDHAARPLAA